MRYPGLVSGGLSSQFARVGPYSLVLELDTGPWGAKWLGFISEGPERGRVVVLRRLAIDPDPAAANRVQQVAEQAREIRHAHVVAVLDVIRTAEEIVIASEQIDGESLTSLLKLAARAGAPMPPAVAMAIARDIIGALLAVRHAWKKAVADPSSPLANAVFGAVTPDSVLLATFGEALLTDLAVAAAAAASPRLARAVGELPYRAPEHMETGHADERSDVFCVGIILWELLAGRALFGGRDRLRRSTALTSTRIEQELRTALIPRLDRLQRPGAPVKQEVADIVERALAREPTGRFSGLPDLLEAIEALPSSLIATEDQVATVVDRLARHQIEARRRAFEQSVGGQVFGSTPPSSRLTEEPAPPSRPIAMVVPGRGWKKGDPADSTAFGTDEAPTKSGGPPAMIGSIPADVVERALDDAMSWPTAGPPPPPRRAELVSSPAAPPVPAAPAAATSVPAPLTDAAPAQPVGASLPVLPPDLSPSESAPDDAPRTAAPAVASTSLTDYTLGPTPLADAALLDPVSAGEGSQAGFALPPVVGPSTPAPPLRRRRGVLALLGALGVAVLLSVGIIVSAGSSPDTPPEGLVSTPRPAQTESPPGVGEEEPTDVEPGEPDETVEPPSPVASDEPPGISSAPLPADRTRIETPETVGSSRSPGESPPKPATRPQARQRAYRPSGI